MMNNELLSVKNLSVAFRQGNKEIQAVDSVSFSILPNQIIGIVGESGSGKSVSMIGSLKLLPQHACTSVDSILWKTKEIKDFSNKEMKALWGKEISYIYQEPSQSYDPLVSILATFKELFLAHHNSKPKLTNADIVRKSVALLQEVGIDRAEERIHSYFHQFSGGMIQRVQIALALAFNPKLLIADEPTTALDVTTQQMVVRLLLDLCKSRNMAMIFITHDLALASSLVDKIIVMKDGKIIEEESPQKILYYPQNAYTKLLVDSTIPFGERYEK